MSFRTAWVTSPDLTVGAVLAVLASCSGTSSSGATEGTSASWTSAIGSTSTGRSPDGEADADTLEPETIFEGSAADEGSFVEIPDGGSAGPCDPAAQDCPPGFKCTSYVSTPGRQTVDATRCAPLIGDARWGEPCGRFEDNDTCAAGLFCMTTISGNTGMGTCLEYCASDVPCIHGGVCLIFNDGVLPLCRIQCDPLAQDCPREHGCYPAFDTFVCAMPGGVDQMRADGDPCLAVQSCNPGLVCLQGTAGCPVTTPCCTPLCAIDDPADPCPDPQESCIPLLDDPPPEATNVGACAVPR